MEACEETGSWEQNQPGLSWKALELEQSSGDIPSYYRFYITLLHFPPPTSLWGASFLGFLITNCSLADPLQGCRDNANRSRNTWKHKTFHRELKLHFGLTNYFYLGT